MQSGAAAAVFLLLLGSTVVRAEDRTARFFDVTRGGKLVATLVAPDNKEPVWDDAIAMITSTVKRWGGAAPQEGLVGGQGVVDRRRYGCSGASR